LHQARDVGKAECDVHGPMAMARVRLWTGGPLPERAADLCGVTRVVQPLWWLDLRWPRRRVAEVAMLQRARKATVTSP
jgi:hypothetical protein